VAHLCAFYDVSTQWPSSKAGLESDVTIRTVDAAIQRRSGADTLERVAMAEPSLWTQEKINLFCSAGFRVSGARLVVFLHSTLTL
jgi:hypothetical protein